MTETQTSLRKMRWNPWPVSIIAFFCFAITGFAVFIWFCNRHPADLVAADYYEQELRYQGQIDRIENVDRNAVGASIQYNAGTRSIVISLPPGSADGKLSGTVQLYRPSAAGMDRRSALQTDAAGLQRIDAADLSPGLWQVRVSWSIGKQEFFLDRRVVIDSPAS